MKTRFLKLALLAVFCVGAAVTNAQTKLSEEAVKVIKELKQVDTKGLSADEAQTALKVLNQIKKQHSDNFVAITAVGEAKAPATPAKNGDAKLGSSKSKPMVVDMTSGVGMKQLAPTRKKFLIDGRETSGEEFAKVLYARKGNVNHRIFKDEESLAKYNAQGYDEVWIIETIKEVKSTEPTQAPAVKAAEPANKNEASVGSKSNPMVFDMTSGMGMKPIRIKYMLDGREVTSKEYFDVMRLRGKEGAKHKTLRDKESLVKYNAQGYDEVWLMETVKGKKSTEQSLTSAVKFADPAKKGEARVGTMENPMDISMITRGGAKQVRSKYILDGREISSSEYWDLMLVKGSNSRFKTKMFNDKESLAKYNAQGYDMVHIMETVKVEKSTTPRVTKFKQKGNQVSFRIEVPKTENAKKQKLDIQYTLPAAM